jgi:hypothetical protein
VVVVSQQTELNAPITRALLKTDSVGKLFIMRTFMEYTMDQVVDLRQRGRLFSDSVDF